jgi:hypothetical protein
MPEGKILMPAETTSTGDQVNPQQPATLDFSQAEYKRFYANHVAASMSLFEVRAIFSSVQGLDPTTDKLIVDETMHIRMAPELAMALLQTLQTTLRDYMKLFGPMRPTRPFPPQATGTPEAPKTAPAPDPDNPPQPAS